ncbi:MAG: nucleotidyltransferase family protein [Lachnospiraceae bacterium]|nr:nucleotidyltransferase family protein [Lachnospiraceae bacterium]
MKTAAIIAEYNPFHEGHAYHIGQTRQITGADYIVTILSGDFVQRGLPAVEEKYFRAHKALESGSDLVLELPLAYALSSARGFAFGGVSLAEGLGCVDYLSFGLEDENNLEAMEALAKILYLQSEKPVYNETLQSAFKSGKSYPAAVSEAVSVAFPEIDARFLTQKQNSNTILALEYLQALHRLKSSIRPVAVTRRGLPYLSESAAALQEGYPSATALRAQLQETEPSDSSLLFPEDFSALLHYKLLSCGYEDLLRYREMTPSLAHKILNALPEFEDYEQFAMLLWTKDTTYSRICRQLACLLLDIKKDAWDVNAPTPYARILGFRKSAAPLLHRIRETSSIPVISKLADAEGLLSEEALGLLNLEVRASRIYDSVRYHKSGERLPGEFQKQVIFV